MKVCTSFFALVASVILLVSVGAQDTFFIQGETQYQGYCGQNAPAPPLGAICFQTSFNINEDVRAGSNGLTAYTTIDGQGFVVILGLAGSTGFFTTDKVRVDMVAIDYTAWSADTCVQYSITDVGAHTATKVGHYCHGQGAVSV